jgi:hypothetical protein
MQFESQSTYMFNNIFVEVFPFLRFFMNLFKYGCQDKLVVRNPHPFKKQKINEVKTLHILDINNLVSYDHGS